MLKIFSLVTFHQDQFSLTYMLAEISMIGIMEKRMGTLIQSSNTYVYAFSKLLMVSFSVMNVPLLPSFKITITFEFSFVLIKKKLQE